MGKQVERYRLYQRYKLHGTNTSESQDAFGYLNLNGAKDSVTRSMMVLGASKIDTDLRDGSWGSLTPPGRDVWETALHDLEVAVG